MSTPLSPLNREPLGHSQLGLDVDLVRGRGGIELDHLALLLKVVDDGHAGLDKGAEALTDALGVVIGAARCLATLEESLLHHLLRAVEEENHLGGADSLLELDGLVHLAGEAVDEEAALGGARLLERLGHGVLEQLDRHLHGYNEAVLDVVLDELAELRAGALLLGAQKVTGGKVDETVLLNQLRALGALAGTGAAENEDDGHIGGAESGRGLGGLGKLASDSWGIEFLRHACVEGGFVSYVEAFADM